MSSPAQETSTIMPLQKFEGHTQGIGGAIHLPEGEQMITSSVDGSLRVWDLKSGKQIGDEWRDGESQVYAIALSPNGKKVVSGSEDGGVRLWDIDTAKVIAKWMGHTKGVWSVCWSRDGRRVLSGSDDGTARQWDVKNGTMILSPIKTGHGRVLAVVYSPDKTMKFATGSGFSECQPRYTNDYLDEPLVKIWDAKTGKLVATLDGHAHWVHSLAWTPDGKTLISGSYDDSIRTWSTETWRQTAVLDGHTEGVFAIAISPNGRILASTSFDSTAQLWNLDNNQPISLPLHHANAVLAVSFSADGKLLATGCDDDIAYAWDVSVIVKGAGLDELLLDQHDKSVLAADATRRPVRQPIKVSNRISQGFFDGTPHRVHSFAQLDLHDAPSRPNIFHWARNIFSARLSRADIQLCERGSAVVDVPHCQAQRRNASAREKRGPTIPLKSKKPAASISESRPPNSNVIQSSGAAEPQSSSQPHIVASTSTAHPVVANTTSSTNLHATMKHAGRWTRFWLFVCCASPEYTDGHH